MNILILNWRDPKHPFAGGAEKSVLNHAKYWAKQGADITWYAVSFDSAKNEETVDGIKIIRKGNYYTILIHFIFDVLLGKFSGFDLFIDCFHFIPFFTPLILPRKKKIALIQETGGKLWFKNIFFPVSLIGYLLEPLFFVFYRNTEFITASNSCKEDLLKFGINEKKIHIVPHGVDKLASKAKKEVKPTVLYLGLLNKDKGFEDACEAAAILRKKIPNLQFFIAGKEGRKGDYNWYIGRARKFAKYFGFVTEKEKFDLYKKSWVLVHPSEKEGWGLTVIEAATQGTPTVGYNVPGLRDSIINNKTGLLVNKNPRELAQAIIALLKSKKLFDRMSSDATVWSKNFNWNTSGEESWQLIKKL